MRFREPRHGGQKKNKVEERRKLVYLLHSPRNDSELPDAKALQKPTAKIVSAENDNGRNCLFSQSLLCHALQNR